MLCGLNGRVFIATALALLSSGWVPDRWIKKERKKESAYRFDSFTNLGFVNRLHEKVSRIL